MNNKSIVTLPKEIYDKLDSLGLNKTSRKHALVFINKLKERSFREYGLINMKVEMHSNYIKKITEKNYKKNWLDKLILSNIIYSDNHYIPLYNNIYKSINYSIIITSPIMSGKKLVSPHKTEEFVCQKKVQTPYEEKVSKRVYEDLNKLKFDSDKMNNLLDEFIDNYGIKDLVLNEDIHRDAMNVIYFTKEGVMKKVYLTREKALEQTHYFNKTLIQDNDKYYMMYLKDFISMKKNALYISYKESLLKFEKKMFFGKRNSTNNRLDSNITNMANILTDQICKDNNLVKFDLCNSQFAILSYMSEHDLQTPDAEIFRQKSYDGVIYEYIQEKLNLPNRKEAKLVMFELMFSKETNNSPLKSKLRALFPSVVKYVDDYKKKEKYNEFSISLQKIESKIFIDGIWTKMKNKKIFALTKHDCIIVKEKDKDLAINMIKDHFDTLNFKGKMIQE